MKRKLNYPRIIGTIIIIILIISIVIGLSFNSQTKEEIVIGSIQALTGETAKHGNNVKDGIDLAVEEINKNGGVNGKKIKIIHEDENCIPTKAVSAAQKLINIDKTKIILGPTCSSSSMAVAPVAEQNKVIMFTPISSVPALRQAGDYIFRNRVSGEPHSIKMANFAYNELNARTASTLYINLDNGISYSEEFIKEFEKLGGKILNTEAYEKGLQDFRTQLLKIKENNPDVIYLAGQASQNAIKQARELGIKTQIIAPTKLQEADLFDIAGDSANGIYYSYESFDPNSKEQVVSYYQEKYKSKYGRESEVFAANAYDAVMLISKALEKCEENTDCIKNHLYSIKNYEGVSGITTFDKDGEVLKPLIIKKTENRKFVFHSN